MKEDEDREGRDDALGERLFDTAIRSERRIEQEVERLLEFFRLRAGKVDLSVQTVDIKEILTNALEVVRPQLMIRKQSASMDVSPLFSSVKVDPDRIVTVLLDILQNAIDFTPRGDRIEVSAEAVEGRVVVRVKDMGPGVPPEERSRLFEPYYQISGTPVPDRRLSRGGSGISLSMARTVIELHGGRIWEEGTRGESAIFCFTLPIAKEPHL